MRKVLALVSFLLLCLASSALAQAPYVPPTLPPLFKPEDIQNSISLMNNIGVAVDARDKLILKHDGDIDALQKTVGAPQMGLLDRVGALEAKPDPAAQITSLTNQVNTLTQQLSDLSAKVAALTNGTVSATNVDFSSCPDGPLNGLFQGVQFGTGFWVCKGGFASPAADGMPSRSFTFAKPVTVVSFSFETTNLARTPGLVLTNSAGQATPFAATAAGTIYTFTPGWSQVTGFKVAASSGGSAPDLLVKGLSLQ